MTRRELIALGSSAAVVWPLTGRAQQSKKTPRLCFLTFDPGTLESTRFTPFFRALRDLGYVNGQTITIDYLSANGHGERFADLAADCLQLKPDVIVVTTTPPPKRRKPRPVQYP
jgi:putative ABC transport system substrate-binding protein